MTVAHAAEEMTSIRRPVDRTARPGRPGRAPTIAAAAYQRLREQIVTLRLAPGAPLAELDLCRRLGVSRTPVRAALQRLQQEGLVVSAEAGAAARAVVAPLTAEDMRELFLMVGALDGVAARQTAELDLGRRERVVRDLIGVNVRLRQLPAAADGARVSLAQTLDRRFHRCYEAAGAGPRLLAKLDALQARRERYVRVYTEALVHARHIRESLSEHDAIIAALSDGDGDAAERLAAFNHRNAIERYRRIVATLGEQGGWS